MADAFCARFKSRGGIGFVTPRRNTAQSRLDFGDRIGPDLIVFLPWQRVLTGSTTKHVVQTVIWDFEVKR